MVLSEPYETLHLCPGSAEEASFPSSPGERTLRNAWLSGAQLDRVSLRCLRSMRKIPHCIRSREAPLSFMFGEWDRRKLASLRGVEA